MFLLVQGELKPTIPPGAIFTVDEDLIACIKTVFRGRRTRRAFRYRD